MGPSHYRCVDARGSYRAATWRLLMVIVTTLAVALPPSLACAWTDAQVGREACACPCCDTEAEAESAADPDRLRRMPCCAKQPTPADAVAETRMPRVPVPTPVVIGYSAPAVRVAARPRRGLTSSIRGPPIVGRPAFVVHCALLL